MSHHLHIPELTILALFTWREEEERLQTSDGLPSLYVWTLDLCILRLPAPWKQMTSSCCWWDFYIEGNMWGSFVPITDWPSSGLIEKLKRLLIKSTMRKWVESYHNVAIHGCFTLQGASFLINEEVLRTVFTEAEWIANSRPLTRNSSSINDNQPLTPSHILNIHPTVNLPPEMVDDSNKFTQKQWRQAQLWLTIIGGVGSGSTFPHYKNARSGRKLKGTYILKS